MASVSFNSFIVQYEPLLWQASTFRSDLENDVVVGRTFTPMSENGPGGDLTILECKTGWDTFVLSQLANLECSATGNPTLEMQVYNNNTPGWTNMITSTQGIGTADATHQCVKTSTTANNYHRTVHDTNHRMKFRIKLSKSGTTPFVAKFDRFEAGTR